MSCFQVNMLIAKLLYFIFQRGDVSLQWLWRSSEVGHCSHDSGRFDGSPYSSLISITQETSVPTLDVSIDRHKLSQELNVPPMDIVLLNLP